MTEFLWVRVEVVKLGVWERIEKSEMLGVRESAGTNRLGNENERVLQRTTSH